MSMLNCPVHYAWQRQKIVIHILTFILIRYSKGCMPSVNLLLCLDLVKKFLVVGGSFKVVETNYSSVGMLFIYKNQISFLNQTSWQYETCFQCYIGLNTKIVFLLWFLGILNLTLSYVKRIRFYSEQENIFKPTLTTHTQVEYTGVKIPTKRQGVFCLAQPSPSLSLMGLS